MVPLAYHPDFVGLVAACPCDATENTQPRRVLIIAGAPPINTTWDKKSPEMVNILYGSVHERGYTKVDDLQWKIQQKMIWAWGYPLLGNTLSLNFRKKMLVGEHNVNRWIWVDNRCSNPAERQGGRWFVKGLLGMLKKYLQISLDMSSTARGYVPALKNDTV